MHKPRRIKITDLNPNLICVLCGGYYVDATTIIECLHSFCKACIVRYLETNRYCPICDVQVHKTKPLQNIRADKTLQDIVYKLVPGLFQNEMRCRREFYAKHPEAQPTSQIDAGDVTDHAYFYAADEAISLSLEYYHSEECSQQKFPCSTRRYFRCPAAVTIAHLQKLIRAKFGLTADYRVDIIYMDKILNEEFTLMDVAYIYRWRRKTPLDLTYRIFECCWSSNKRLKLEHNTDPSVKDQEQTSGKEETMEVDGVSETNAKTETEIEENNSGGAETWKEVQLQISENGVMSVTDISTSSQGEANNNTLENCIAEGSYCLKTKYMENEKVLNTDVIKDINDSVASEETKSTPATASPTLTTTTSSMSLATTSATSTSMAVTTTSTAMQNWPKKQEQQKASLDVVAPTSFTEAENTKSSITQSAKQNHSPVVNQHSLPSVVTSSGSSTITTTTPVPSLASQHKNDLSVFTKKPVEINKNIKKQQLLQSQPLALKVSTTVTAPTAKAKDNIANNVTPKRDPLKTAVVAPTQSILTNSTASRKPLTSSGSSAPVGYKTLKTPPKSWNQSITRLSFLSSAKNHTYAANVPSSVCESKVNDQLGRQQGETAMISGPNKQQGHSSAVSAAGAPASPTKPNRFFKMRMPRYLGNPASGVKPMYQVATSIGKQDLPSQATSQVQSSAKPLYQMATSPHNVTPAHSSSGGQKLPYSSGNPTQAHLHSMMAFPMGIQQTNKLESCPPSSNAKHFPLPAMNQQMRDCTSSTAHLLSQSLDIKPMYTNSNQLQEKHQDGGNAVPPTSYTSSTAKSLAAVSVPCNSSLTSTSKSKNSSMNKQECMPQNGKSKPEIISPPVSKHNNVTLMKIDPKTLSPIVVGANSAPNTPPLPHSPSPPSPMTPQNLKSRSQPFPLPAHSNSNKGSPPLGSPFLPNLLYPSFPFPGMVGGNRMGAGPPSLVRAPGGMGLGAYHPLPPSINMLFNPHHRTHTHNSPNSGSQSPSLIPPPAVQRIPASSAHHKNSPSPTGILNKPSPAHSPSPLPQPAKAHMTSRSSCNISQTVSGPAPRQSAEGESAERGLQKTVSAEVTRTVNGEQNDGETNRTVDNSGNQDSNSKVNNNNNGDGSSSGDGERSSTSASEQGISNVNNFITEEKVPTSSGENGQQISDIKKENSGVTHNQLNQKQEINETGNNKEEESKKNAAEESKTQSEKT